MTAVFLANLSYAVAQNILSLPPFLLRTNCQVSYLYVPNTNSQTYICAETYI